jgi:hypothetical protein
VPTSSKRFWGLLFNEFWSLVKDDLMRMLVDPFEWNMDIQRLNYGVTL